MLGQVRAYTNIIALHNVNCLSDSYLIARKGASVIRAFTYGRLRLEIHAKQVLPAHCAVVNYGWLLL